MDQSQKKMVNIFRRMKRKLYRALQFNVDCGENYHYG